jgi:hypothetical protein
MIYTKRLEWYYGPIFNYWIKWYSQKNPNDSDKYWQYEETWFVSVQLFSPFKWLGRDEFYYDGHTAKSITILGVRFTKGYSYQAERIV